MTGSMDTEAVEANLAGGKTYYVRITQSGGGGCSPSDTYVDPVTQHSKFLADLDEELAECKWRALDAQQTAMNEGRWREQAAHWKTCYEGPGKKECTRLSPEDGR